MSVTIVADLEFKEEELPWVKSFLAKVLAEAPEKIEGFENGEIVQNQDDPNNLIFWAQFATREHHSSYAATTAEHYSEADLQRYSASFSHPPDVRCFKTISE